MIRMISLMAAAVATLVTAASGQDALDSDLYAATTGGLYQIDRNVLSRHTTLFTSITASAKVEFVIPDQSNSGAAFLESSTAGFRLLRYNARTQTTSSLIALAGQGPAECLAVDQDGQYVIGLRTARRLLKTSGLFSQSVTTLFTGFPGSGQPIGLCIDDDTGDYIVALHSTSASSGLVVRIDRNTRALTTIASGITELRSVDHDQITGRFLVTRGADPHIMQLNRNGSIHNSRRYVHAQGAVWDDLTGRFCVWNSTELSIFDGQFNRIDYHKNTSIGTFNQCGFAHGRKLFGRPANTARAGTTFVIGGRFPDSPRASYVLGLGAAGLRPGLVRNGRYLNVGLDALFFRTVAGGLPVFTTGFIGTLDAGGGLVARFLVPRLPPGLRTLTVAGAAINAAKPGNLDLAQSLTVRLAP